MLSRSRWARPAGVLGIAVLAGVAFTGCGDDGDDSDTSTDEGAEENAADGGDTTDGPPTEAPPEAVEFCEAFDEFELTVVGDIADEMEAPGEAEYFSVVSDNFDTLADTEAPEEIADAWATWTTAVGEAYDQLTASAAEADPEDPESEGVLSEDFASLDEEVVDAETEINTYRDENCPPPEDIEPPEGADGAGAEADEAETDAAEEDGEAEAEEPAEVE